MKSLPLHAIVLRFNNDATHEALERVMREFPFAYLASVCEQRYVYEGLPSSAQEWWNSSDARGGLYAGSNPNTLMPLDADLLERMQETEAIFMHMVTRIEYARKISYDDRKRMYRLHLRFWNDLIERRKINLVIAGILPHEIPDYVIYGLCKAKDIPILYFHATTIRDCAFLEEDWEISAVQAGKRYAELLQEHMQHVELPTKFEEYFREQSAPAGAPAIAFRRPTAVDRILRTFTTHTRTSVIAFVRWLPMLVSVAAWHRRLEKFRTFFAAAALRKFYDAHAVAPDLSVPYIYVPLHFQPECSTCPMAGAFADQLVEVELLSATAPSDVLLYVKEHPRQYRSGTACRSIAVYNKLITLPNVRLISQTTDSFLLREHARAIATGTGTAGFEALFRGKPVLLFGHRFYQYAPGVYRIRTREDCVRAMEAIFTRRETPDIHHVRLYLKAIADTSVEASANEWHQSQASNLSRQEHVRAIADALTGKIKAQVRGSQAHVDTD